MSCCLHILLSFNFSRYTSTKFSLEVTLEGTRRLDASRLPLFLSTTCGPVKSRMYIDLVDVIWLVLEKQEKWS